MSLHAILKMSMFVLLGKCSTSFFPLMIVSFFELINLLPTLSSFKVLWTSSPAVIFLGQYVEGNNHNKNRICQHGKAKVNNNITC